MDVKENEVTADNIDDIVLWINSQSTGGQSLATGQKAPGFERIYLPLRGGGVSIVEPGDTVAVDNDGWFYVAAH